MLGWQLDSGENVEPPSVYRGWRMDYRLYCMNGDGHIGLADWIRADTDESAIAQARILKPEMQKCEIWQRDRLVAKLGLNGAADLSPDL